VDSAKRRHISYTLGTAFAELKANQAQQRERKPVMGSPDLEDRDAALAAYREVITPLDRIRMMPEGRMVSAVKRLLADVRKSQKVSDRSWQEYKDYWALYNANHLNIIADWLVYFIESVERGK
jgi:hypothetical protein